MRRVWEWSVGLAVVSSLAVVIFLVAVELRMMVFSATIIIFIFPLFLSLLIGVWSHTLYMKQRRMQMMWELSIRNS